MIVNDIDLTLPKFLDRSRPEVRKRLEKGAAAGVERARVTAAEQEEKRVSAQKKLRAEIEAEGKREAGLAALAAQKTEPKSSTETKPVSKPVSTPKRKANDYDPNAVIRVVIKENPHREGSKAVDKFNALRDGMTVEEYLNVTLTGVTGKWQKGMLRYCLDKGFIKIEG